MQGIVQDVLTNSHHHYRGIKVRLSDGRVGRVQRMVGVGEVREGGAERWPPSMPTAPVTGGDRQAQRRVGEDRENGDMPPARSLADFIPDNLVEPPVKETVPEQATFASATVSCPICGNFEGDEAAVSHHVQTHLD